MGGAGGQGGPRRGPKGGRALRKGGVASPPLPIFFFFFLVPSLLRFAKIPTGPAAKGSHVRVGGRRRAGLRGGRVSMVGGGGRLSWSCC